MSDNHIIQIKKKMPLQITTELINKYIHYKKIPESLLNIIELINISLFKYIDQEKINEKLAKVKLMYINNLITDILYNNTEIKNPPKNPSAKTRKAKYHLTTLDNNNNNNNLNSEILNEIKMNNLIKFRLKKKLKCEHDKFVVKEMEYLQRILELQSQVNTYEKSIGKINNENISKMHNFEIIRNNSAKSLTVKNKQNIRAFQSKNKNNNKSNSNNNIDRRRIKIVQSFTNSFGNSNIQYYRGENQKVNRENSVSSIDSYIHSNIYRNKNKNSDDSNNQNRKLEYKYQIGKGYFRNKFFKLKKDIKEQNNYLQKVRDILSEIK